MFVFCCRVVEHSSRNRMEAQNVAIVFGPTLLAKPPNDFRSDVPGGGSMAVEMHYQTQIIEHILAAQSYIFT